MLFNPAETSSALHKRINAFVSNSKVNHMHQLQKRNQVKKEHELGTRPGHPACHKVSHHASDTIQPNFPTVSRCHLWAGFLQKCWPKVRTHSVSSTSAASSTPPSAVDLHLMLAQLGNSFDACIPGCRQPAALELVHQAVTCNQLEGLVACSRPASLRFKL